MITSAPTTVVPDNGQPGGGTEMTTDNGVDVGGIQFSRFEG